MGASSIAYRRTFFALRVAGNAHVDDPAFEEASMSIRDKVSGRAKKAAGDLTGNRELYQQGAREERRGEAKEQSRRAQERAERKAAEVRSLEHATNPRALAEDHSKDELYDRAQQLGIEGRSEMTKEELAAEISRRE
jgi:uncharacterized protein YjbJ (UPF0337 family)